MLSNLGTEQYSVNKVEENFKACMRYLNPVLLHACIWELHMGPHNHSQASAGREGGMLRSTLDDRPYHITLSIAVCPIFGMVPS